MICFLKFITQISAVTFREDLELRSAALVSDEHD